MTVWRTLHSINEDVSFSLGLFLNILLLVVIRKVEVKSMKEFNILLLQCCCVDMFQLLTSFIVKPITVMHNKSEYFLSNGFLRSFGGDTEMLGIILWGVSVFFCIDSMPITFIFRYRAVCLNATTSKGFYVLSLVISFLIASTFGVIVWKLHYIENSHLAHLAEENFGWLIADDEGKVKAASVCLGVSFFIILRNV